jgi:hypothetical protein
MLRTISIGTVVVALAWTAPLNAQQPQPTPVQPSPVKRTILQKSDVPGTNLEMIYASV